MEDNSIKVEKARKVIKEININMIIHGICLVLIFILLIAMLIGLFFNISKIYYNYINILNIFFLLVLVGLSVHFSSCQKRIERILKE